MARQPGVGDGEWRAVELIRGRVLLDEEEEVVRPGCRTGDDIVRKDHLVYGTPWRRPRGGVAVACRQCLYLCTICGWHYTTFSESQNVT